MPTLAILGSHPAWLDPAVTFTARMPAKGIRTRPHALTMGSGESLPLGLDVSDLMRDDDVLLFMATTLTDLWTDMAYTTGLGSGPFFKDAVIVQVVQHLRVGGRYRLEWQYTLTGARTYVSELLIEVPY